MSTTVVRITAALPGVLLAVSGVGWLTDPATAAEGLGMPLLDGIGRSTQIGDFGAFFLSGAGMAFIGAWTAQPAWLLAPALLLGSAACMRVFAFLAHGAPFATMFVAIELAMTGILMTSALLLSRAGRLSKS